MPSIKEYQNKITSLKNSRKITGSMKMISSIKFQKMGRLYDASAAFRQTARHMESVLMRYANKVQSPVLSGYPRLDTIHILLITGDRGLCGRFNANTINAMLEKANDELHKSRTVTFSTIGLRGAAYCKRHSLPYRAYDGIIANPDWEKVGKVADELFVEFNAGSYQEVWSVYSKRISSMAEQPIVERVLPFTADTEISQTTDYTVEGNIQTLCRSVYPLIVKSRIYEGIIESAFAEHSARMDAMDSASSNCDRLISEYTQLRNRARQAVITTELNEIVTGKEALEA